MISEKPFLAKSISLLLVLCFIACPLLIQAGQVSNAIVAGERQAEMDASRTLSFILGCVIGPVGLLICYLVPFTSAPGDALVGKSSEYVFQYTDAYNRRIKSIQGSKALIGCLVGAGVYGLCWLLYALLLVDTVDNTDYWYYY